MTQDPAPEAPAPPPQPAGQPAHEPESGLPQARRGRLAFPGAPPSAPSYEDEVRAALSYEKGLVLKALVAAAIVGLVLMVRFFLLG